MPEHPLYGESIRRNEATENSGVDDAIDINDNSFIGIVKSRIVRILPNRITKWFSKSAKAQKRRHRLSEVDNEDCIEDTNEYLQSKYEECHDRNRWDRQNENSEEDRPNDKSHNSGEKFHKRNLNSFQTTTPEPPAKRSRIASTQNISLMASNRSLIALTSPKSSSKCRSCNGGALLRSSGQRGYTQQIGRKQCYDFMVSKLNVKTNIEDIVSTPIELWKDVSSGKSGALNISQINSRRTLSVPPTASNFEGADNFATISSPSLSSVKQGVSTDVEAETVSCCIEDINQSRKQSGFSKDEEGDGEISKVRHGDANQSMATTETHSEKDESGIEDVNRDTTVDTARRETEKIYQQRKIGLYDMIPVSGTRQGSRPSFHRERHKSLPAEANIQGSISDDTSTTSTLLLNSKFRNQLNAWNSGSTSTIRNRRSPNILSPFYEGKTTYGGAATYHKVDNSIGVRPVHKARAVKRPFLTLSNSSLSNISLAATDRIRDKSSMPRGAKHVLHLINDFSTPSGKAKNFVRNVNPSNQLVAETPSSSVNLLMMKPVPQSDIQLAVSPSSTTTKQQTVAAATTLLAQNEQAVRTLTNLTASEPLLGTFTTKHTTNFLFSPPQTHTDIPPLHTQNIKLKQQHYEFSSPIYLQQSCKSKSPTGNLDHKIGTQPKSGSFSETLNKELLTSFKSKAEASKTTLDGTFQFRKSEDERKCNVCRVCKNSEAVKCSACEITKKFEKQQTCLTTTFNNLPLNSSADTLAIKSSLSAVDFGTQSSASTCDSGTFTENSSDNINKGSCNGTTRIQQGNVPTSVTSGFAFKTNSETILSTSDATTTTSVSCPSMAEQATNSQITSQAIFVDPAVQSSIDSLFFTSFVNTAKPAFNTGATVTQQSVYNFTESSESMLTTKPHFNGDSTSTSRNNFMPASMPGDRLARKRRRKIRRIK
uniref:Uncharacterized protein n=1 Tax=Glossina palpalis gambiensis TaxID=67801 RepID=A0A1B0BD69_9MUSC